MRGGGFSFGGEGGEIGGLQKCQFVLLMFVALGLGPQRPLLRAIMLHGLGAQTQGY